MNIFQLLGKKIAMLFACVCLGTLVHAADVDEIPASIVKVDVQKNSVTLFDLGRGKLTYQFAYDLEIKLMGGDNGTISNLRAGDGVTAVVDSNGSIVHAIYVVSESR